jgi:hypothetical protein
MTADVPRLFQMNVAKYQCDQILMPHIQFVRPGARKSTAYRRRNGNKYRQFATISTNLA